MKIKEKKRRKIKIKIKSILSDLNKFGLTAEHEKLEVFYFSRLTKNFNLSSLDLFSLEGSIL